MLKIFLTDCLQEFWFLFCYFFPFQQLFYSSSPSFTYRTVLNTYRTFAHTACEKLDNRNCREGKKQLKVRKIVATCSIKDLRPPGKTEGKGQSVVFPLCYWEQNSANRFEEKTAKKDQWHPCGIISNVSNIRHVLGMPVQKDHLHAMPIWYKVTQSCS